MIAIIDYGAGNIHSVAKAIAKLGYQPEITANPRHVLEASAVILPGVGAAGDTMHSLQAIGLIDPILRVVAEDRPFLGICIGLQVLFTTTAEGGGYDCLNLIPGTIKRLPTKLKVPHMGWNQVNQKITHPLFNEIPDGAYFYFVHSYYADLPDKSLIAAETEYSVTFPSVVIKGNLVATQFHPEKSGELGLKIYDNFLRLVSGAR